jgi:hypothetical protein
MRCGARQINPRSAKLVVRARHDEVVERSDFHQRREP